MTVEANRRGLPTPHLSGALHRLCHCETTLVLIWARMRPRSARRRYECPIDQAVANGNAGDNPGFSPSANISLQDTGFKPRTDCPKVRQRRCQVSTGDINFIADRSHPHATRVLAFEMTASGSQSRMALLIRILSSSRNHSKAVVTFDRTTWR